MRDRIVIGLGLAVLALATLACNAFAGRTELSPPPPLPTVAATADAFATPALAPTATLPGDTAPTAGRGRVRVLVDLNVRAGPGVAYERVGFMLRDEVAVVLGRDPAGGWWQIECPPRAEGAECWISGGAQYTQTIAADAPTPATTTP